MQSFTSSNIQTLALHQVGNQQNDELLTLSKTELYVNDEVKQILTSYFLSPFKSEEYYRFYHNSGLDFNEVYTFVSRIFDHPEQLFEQSVNLAKHLYEQSTHPKIKSGEFYTVYFKDCIIEGEMVDAVGLFKSENKDTFLKVFPKGDGFGVESQLGVNINKLDKGCLIFNTEQADGFVVSVVDNTNKGTEAHYWIDDFLHVSQRQDKYFNTENAISLCKNFVTQALPKEFNVNKADQVDMLNRSAKFFKEKESFDIEEFENEVIEQQSVIDSFKQYKEDFQKERDIEIVDKFDISVNAVKKQSRVFKSIIKLDKNFHIYIHGNKELIERGYDEERGLYFYQLFFKEEE